MFTNDNECCQNNQNIYLNQSLNITGGYITVSNHGAYVAFSILSYNISGDTISFSTPKLTIGQSYTFSIPVTAKNININSFCYVTSLKTTSFCKLHSDAPPQTRITLSGTVLNPKCSQNDNSFTGNNPCCQDSNVCIPPCMEQCMNPCLNKPAGYIEVINRALYIAFYVLTFYAGDKPEKIVSPNLKLGQSYKVLFPSTAKQFTLTAYLCTAPGLCKQFCRKTYDNAGAHTILLIGTVFNPACEESN